MSNEVEIARANRVLGALESITRDIAIVVIGDSMLDRYIWGSIERISPEAPVPIVRKAEETARPGGAANVALNIAGLGARVSLVSIVGQDNRGEELLKILSESNIETDCVCTAAEMSTITKTRIITGHQHVLRVDEDPPDGLLHEDLSAQVAEQAARALAKKPDAIILSDYRKGTLTATICSDVIRQAAELEIPVFIDPKGSDYRRYAGADAITPNLMELELVTGADRNDIDSLIDAGRDLADSLNLGSLVLTRGADGITLIDAAETLHSPARAQEVFDVSGAGDTVIASLTLARVLNMEWPDALHLANVAAGLVVQRRGAVPVQRAELLNAVAIHGNSAAQSILALDKLRDVVDEWRRNGDRIVFTNGCFDILHAGHISYLSAAAAEGDRLIVGLNTDDSTRKLKGDGRPVNNQENRAKVLAALRPVDAVVLFDDPTPIDLINELQPDVLVKGADYTDKVVVGAQEVESWGGRVVLAAYIDGFSTSSLIERLHE